MSKVLICPIGNTDPIRNEYDGPLIHICRFFKPNKIYMLLTNEMLERHKKYNVYIKALDDLYKGINEDNGCYSGHKMDYECIPVILNIEDASDFNAFICYKDIIDKIVLENKDSEILANITSGTPQMISMLCTDIVMNNRKIIPVQVVTSIKKSNTNIPHEKFDENKMHPLIDSLDNYPENHLENRCKVVELVNLRKHYVKNNLLVLIDEYSYKKGISLLKEEKCINNKKLEELVLSADSYMYYHFDDAIKILKKNNINLLNDKGKEINDLLYGYNYLSVKLNLHEISEFAIKITPLLYHLCLFIINSNKKMKDELDAIKDINERGVLCYRGPNGSLPPLGSEQLLKIIIDNDIEFIDDGEQMLSSLRNVEKNVRNSTAHDYIFLNESKFKELSGITPAYTLSLFKKIIKGVTFADEDDFKFFDKINEKIHNEINKII